MLNGLSGILRPAMNFVAFFVVLIFSGAVFQQTYEHPKYNPDLISYLSVILDNELEDGDRLNLRVREEILQNTSEHIVQKLEADDFTGTLLTDEEALRQHMPFFESRYGYLAIIKAGNNITGSLVSSTILIGAVSAASITFLVGLYMLRFGFMCVLLTMLAIPYLGVIDVGREQSPDALAVLLLLAFIYSIGRHAFLTLLLAILIVSIRPDYIVFTSITVLVLFLYERVSLKVLISVLLVTLIPFIFTKFYFDGYSHQKLFHYTLISQNFYPQDMVISADLGDYLKAYFRGVYSIVFGKYVVIYLLVVGLLISYLEHDDRDLGFCLCLASISMIFVHFCLFPAAFDRFYIAPNIIIFISLLKGMIRHRSETSRVGSNPMFY